MGCSSAGKAEPDAQYLRASVRAGAAYGIPVTVKFRKGIYDDLLTFFETGRIAEEEGVAAIALHARTAEQHYAGLADWNAIGELKAHVSSYPGAWQRRHWGGSGRSA